MKSLILKDLYNIGHHMKTMGAVLLFLALAMIPGGSAGGYVLSCGFSAR